MFLFRDTFGLPESPRYGYWITKTDTTDKLIKMLEKVFLISEYLYYYEAAFGVVIFLEIVHLLIKDNFFVVYISLQSHTLTSASFMSQSHCMHPHLT